MKVRSDRLTARRTALLCSAVLIAMIPASVTRAADTLPVKAVPAVDMTGWYFGGVFEVGGNIFLQKPGNGFGRTATSPFWLTPTTTDSDAKMNEYFKVPTWFLNGVELHAGSNDGRYIVDFWGGSIDAYGNSYLGDTNSNSFWLRLAEVGRHYVDLGWDQTPHILGTSAKTVFSGVGTTRLTVDPTLRTNLQNNVANALLATAAGTTARNNIEGFVNNAETNITLKTMREKFFGAYRATPNDDWDFNFDYSHEHRTGTRPLGINWGLGTTANPRPSSGSIEVAQPLDDTTQNLNASGEYIGTTPWGTRWNAALKYFGSIYENSNKSIDVDNPFCSTCSPAGSVISTGSGTQFGPSLLRYGLYPNNHVNSVSLVSGVDLPIWKSRYTSTLQYSMFRQNDPFINTATNGITVGTGVGQLNPLPASSLNGELNTFLSNNVLTSHLTKDVTNTARLRYYDVKDNTPTLVFTNYVYADGGVATTAPLTRMPHSYTKLNISDDAKWRVNKQWAVGAGYFFERYSYTNGEIDASNENGGKIFVDAIPADWVNSRVNLQYQQRRYSNYTGNQGDVQTNPMRIFIAANRDRTKGDALIEFSVMKNVTITPNGGIRWDDYPDGVANLLGKTSDHSWNVGSDLAVRVTPDLLLSFSYNYEEHKIHMAECCGATVTDIAANTWKSDITQHYNTFIVSGKWMAIPGKLEFKADYLAAIANEANLTTPCTNYVANNGCAGLGTGITSLSQTQFPDEHNIFQRFSFLARYIFDQSTVKQMGWNGEVSAKARYIWERNHNTNWATDTFSPYSPSSADSGGDTTNGGRSLFLAYNNPNYTAQILALSLAFKW